METPIKEVLTGTRVGRRPCPREGSHVSDLMYCFITRVLTGSQFCHEEFMLDLIAKRPRSNVIKNLEQKNFIQELMTEVWDEIKNLVGIKKETVQEIATAGSQWPLAARRGRKHGHGGGENCSNE